MLFNLKPINFPTEKTKTKTPFESDTIRPLTEAEKLIRSKIDDLMAGKFLAEKLSDIPSTVSKDGKVRPLILSHKILNKFVMDHGLNMSLDNLVINANDWEYLIKNFRDDEDSINIIKEIPDSDNFLTIGASRQNGFFALTHYETITKSSNKLKNLLEKGEVLVNTSGASSPTMKQILSGSDSMGRIKFTVFNTNISNLPPKTEPVKPLDLEALPQDKEIPEDDFLKFLAEDKKEYDELLAKQKALEGEITEDIPFFTKAEEAAAIRENLRFPNGEMESQYHKFRERYSKFATKPEDVVQFKTKVPESKNWFYTQEGDQYDSDIYDLFVERYNAEKTANKISRPKYKKQLSQAELKTKLETREIKKETMERLRAIYINKVTQIREKANSLLKGIKASELRRREELIAANAHKSELSALKERIIAREKINRIETAKQVVERRRAFVKAIQRQFGLSDADVKSITKRDIRLMTDYDFSGFLEDLRKKSQELAVWNQARYELIQQIKDKQLNVENLRQAMKLPQIKEMTLGQLSQFDEALRPYKFGDVFLGQRKLETIDRTELKGLKTWREVRERLAKKLDLPEVTTDLFRIQEVDRYKGISGLAEKDPFFKMVVTDTSKIRLLREAEYLEIEKKTNEAAKKLKTTLLEKIIPGQKNIVKWFNAEDKNSVQLNPAEAEIVKIMQEELGRARDYLIKVEAMEKGIASDKYYPHARRGFLEAVINDGVTTAWRELFQKYKLEEKAFNILDTETGEILALDKFFANALHRVKNKDFALVPTENVVGAFLGYMKKFKLKQALDELVPVLDIYAHALTPRGVTKTGLPIHASLIRFMKEWLNTQKGRSITLLTKQGGKLDLGLRAGRAFTSILDLGLSIPVNIATQVGEQVVTFQTLGNRNYLKGKLRSTIQRDKTKRVVLKYRNFIGKNPWSQIIEPMRPLGDRLSEGLFILFRDATVRRNKNILIGSMTDAEWASETLSPERLAQLKIDTARYTVQEGAESIVGATPEFKSLKQYKSWAIPILSTTARNLKYTAKYIGSLGKLEGTRGPRAIKELLRILELGLIVVTVGAFAGIGDDDEEDDTMVGKLKKKAYQENLSIY